LDLLVILHYDKIPTKESRVLNKTILFVRFSIICVAAAAVFTAVFTAPAYSEEQDTKTVKLCPGLTTHQNIFSKVSEAFEKKEKIKIALATDPEKVNAVGNLKALLEGKCDAAVNAVDFDGWIKDAKSHGVAVEPSKLTYRVIGRDYVHVIANKSAGLKDVKREALVEIFSGKATNWKELGGADQSIKIFLSKDKPSSANIFRGRILKNSEFAKSVTMVPGWDDVVKAVSIENGGVGLIPYSDSGPKVVTLTGVDLGRPVTLITIGRPNPNVMKLISFIAGDGKDLIK
jgi:ABC-type phosphate transport system substrate-binding protein